MLFFQPNDGWFADALVNRVSASSYAAYESLTILVAYARHSGVARLAEHLEAFKAAGGTVLVVVGINQKQTTVEALELLLKAGVSLFVFFDEDEYRTFHPKVYWLVNTATRQQWSAIGSNNLTAGGLYLNYEMSVVADDSLASAEGRKQAKAMLELIETTRVSGHVKKIDAAAIKELVDGGYIVSEHQASSERADRNGADGSPLGKPKKASLFARSKKVKLPSIPAKYRLPKPPKAPGPMPPPAGPVPTPPPSVGTPGAGFWKKLSNSDASGKSSPGQVIIPIAYLKYFPALGSRKAMKSGGIQSDVLFDVQYKDGSKQPRLITGARVILYEPSEDHPRKNKEVRFTLRDMKAREDFEPGDVLEFRPTGLASPAVVVTRIPSKSNKRSGRFGVIP